MLSKLESTHLLVVELKLGEKKKLSKKFWKINLNDKTV